MSIRINENWNNNLMSTRKMPSKVIEIFNCENSLSFSAYRVKIYTNTICWFSVKLAFDWISKWNSGFSNTKFSNEINLDQCNIHVYFHSMSQKLLDIQYTSMQLIVESITKEFLVFVNCSFLENQCSKETILEKSSK